MKWNLNRCGHLDYIQLAGQCSQGCAELWHYFREEKNNAFYHFWNSFDAFMKWHLQHGVGRNSDIQRSGSISTAAEVRWIKWLWLSTTVPKAVCLSWDSPQGAMAGLGRTKRSQEVETGKDKQDSLVVFSQAAVSTALPRQQVSLCTPLLLRGGAVSTVWSRCTMRAKCLYHVG